MYILKTDSLYLHNYTMLVALKNRLEILESNRDIYGSGWANELLSIKTKYETQFLQQGLPITYMAFRLESHENLRVRLVEPEVTDYSALTPEDLSGCTQ